MEPLVSVTSVKDRGQEVQPIIFPLFVLLFFLFFFNGQAHNNYGTHVWGHFAHFFEQICHKTLVFVFDKTRPCSVKCRPI